MSANYHRTAERPPTKDDGRYVLACDHRDGTWERQPTTSVATYTSLYPYWQPMPPPPDTVRDDFEKWEKSFLVENGGQFPTALDAYRAGRSHAEDEP